MNAETAKIEMDTSIQCRAAIDMGLVNEYAERMTDGDKFPPVELFGSNGRLWIGDGWHRIMAADQIGAKVTAANKDVEIMDVQAALETAQASLADVNAELAQNKATVIAWSGLASFYADAHHGKRTASGSRFDMNAFTAAHRTLPFGSLVLVLDVRRFTWVLVKIEDRGPATWTGREIDLSRAAAKQLGMEHDGVIPALMLTVQGRPSTQD